MTREEVARLTHRRQYVLVPEKIDCPFLHNVQKIGDSYFLYTHCDLKVTHHSSQGASLVLLGDIFDYRYPLKENKGVLIDLIGEDFENLLQKMDQYTGRYVLIVMKRDKLHILHDATASRKVFYASRNSRLWLASQAPLLARIMDLKITSDPSRRSYYLSKDFNRHGYSGIGNTTIYDEITQLMPNHYLDVLKKHVVRYWPYQKLTRHSMDDVEDMCACVIKGYMESIASRYAYMLPVTSGKDSRMILAGARNVLDRGIFYVNRMNLRNKASDIRVPKALFSDLHLEFKVVENEKLIDPDFIKVYFANNPSANKVFLPVIYRYYTSYGDRINVPGNFASGGFEHYKCYVSRVNAKRLARYNGAGKYAFAVEYYKSWLQEVLPLCEETGMQPFDLFYWEERLGNWGTQIQLDKDIAQEDINVFNSRLLISLFLSLDPETIIPPDFIFQKRIIAKLWPELLSRPINPTFRFKFEHFLKQVHLLAFINNLRCLKHVICD